MLAAVIDGPAFELLAARQAGAAGLEVGAAVRRERGGVIVGVSELLMPDARIRDRPTDSRRAADFAPPTDGREARRESFSSVSAGAPARRPTKSQALVGLARFARRRV